MIPYGRQSISEEDISAVVEVLRSGFLTQGNVLPHFEKVVADYVGAEFAVATNSATSALHLACMALGLQSGDYLWTSPITFVASSNCGLYCDAQVDFVDINPQTYNISVDSLREKLRRAEISGKLPKVLVAVHMCGQSCEMESIRALSKQYGFKIVEDASHAIGGKYQGSYIGNCKYSDITVFSFHPVKIVTTGEGGMALTNDSELAEMMALLRSHGVTRDSAHMTKPSEGPWYYQQVKLGYNYRMTDIQAALGISQMNRIEQFISSRHDIAARYDKYLSGLPIICPRQHPDSYSSYHLYIVLLQLDFINKDRKEVFEFLRNIGIGVNVHYIPVHMQPYYQSLGFQCGNFPEAESYYSRAISLPIFPGLAGDEQQMVVDAIYKAVADE